MSNTGTQTQIIREAPEVEGYKLGLLQAANQLIQRQVPIPVAQAAGLTPQQTQALSLAGTGIESYRPFISSAADLFSGAGAGYQQIPAYGQRAISEVDTAQQQALAQYGTLPGYAQQAATASGGYGATGAGLGVAGAQAYDPNSVFAYMNPYQQAVTQNAVAEMGRQAQIQQQQMSAQAVKSGAFGGSREGVQRAELGRNLADIQSRRVLEDYFANYSQAQQAAMNAFANQQARTQNAGNLAIGAGQLGVTGAAQAGQLQQAAGQGIGALGQMGANAALQAGQLQQASAAGIGALGQQTAALGQLQSGLQQGDVSFLYNIGTQQQQQRQRELDAQRQTQMQTLYEPYQRLGFLSDIYKGAPTTQMTIGQTTAPQPSLVSQVAGLGTAALAAYNLMPR
jgi:hypothetical protein